VTAALTILTVEPEPVAASLSLVRDHAEPDDRNLVDLEVRLEARIDVAM